MEGLCLMLYRHSIVGLVALAHRDVNENLLACNHREAIARLPHWPSLLWNLLSRLNYTYIMTLQAIAVCTRKLHVHTVIACRPRCPWFRMRSTESLVLVTWYLIIVNDLKVSFDNFLKRSDNVEDYYSIYLCEYNQPNFFSQNQITSLFDFLKILK